MTRSLPSSHRTFIEDQFGPPNGVNARLSKGWDPLQTLLTELASAGMDSQCMGVSIVLFSISTKRGVRTPHPDYRSPPDAKRTSPVSWLLIRFHLSGRVVSRGIIHSRRQRAHDAWSSHPRREPRSSP